MLLDLTCPAARDFDLTGWLATATHWRPRRAPRPPRRANRSTRKAVLGAVVATSLITAAASVNTDSADDWYDSPNTSPTRSRPVLAPKPVVNTVIAAFRPSPAATTALPAAKYASVDSTGATAKFWPRRSVEAIHLRVAVRSLHLLDPFFFFFFFFIPCSEALNAVVN